MSESAPASASGIKRQMTIYLEGRAGHLPGQPVAIEDLAKKAKSILKPETYDYLVGGAGSGDTMRANQAAFERWRIVPRFLRNVASRELAVEVLGQRLPAPLLLAPIGVQGIFHPEGELPSAGGRVAFASLHRELCVFANDGGSRRRHAWSELLVSALLAEERRAGAELLASRRECRIPGGGRYVGYVVPRVARA